MRRRALAGLALSSLAFGATAHAQAFPSRPIRLISPFPPGGGTDLIARAVANKLSEVNRWSVVVENRSGANGTIGLAEAARAAPTGYEIVLGQKDNLIITPLLSRVSFDPVKDFTPITFIGTTSIVIIAAANSPYRSFADVMRAAAQRPEELSFGSSGTGSISHITSEMLRLRANLRLQHVPYRGSNPALTDLLAGHVTLVGASIASAMGMIRSGEVRALAISGARRSASLPDVPTLQELGLNTDVTAWWGFLGPAGMPRDVAQTLAAAINAIADRPEVNETFAGQGVDRVVMTPEAFGDFVRDEFNTWRAIIAEAGIRLE